LPENTRKPVVVTNNGPKKAAGKFEEMDQAEMADKIRKAINAGT